ncbi:MAG TPA: hypothetical protein VJ553_03645 [Candidatus Paceibacterota bacterium]|nr:hypothetical protein [Candidatus Paceibacterota bacterium]
MIIILTNDLKVAEKLDVATAAARVGTPRLRSSVEEGTVRSVGYEEVGPDDPRYETALAIGLTVQGQTALVAGPAFVDLLDLLSTDTFTVDQRRHIISIIRNLPSDEAAEMARTILEIAHLHEAV